MIPSWRNVPELADRHKLAVLVMEEGSAQMIARRLGCSKASVKSALLFHGLVDSGTVNRRIQ